VQKPGVSEGFIVGLRFWLFFLVVFALIGYSAFMSILLGAIGALAAGFIQAWNTSKATDPAKPEADASKVVPEGEIDDAPPRKQRSRYKQKKQRKPPQRPQRRSRQRDARPISRFFGRRSS
jgi:hypothetical protein